MACFVASVNFMSVYSELVSAHIVLLAQFKLQEFLKARVMCPGNKFLRSETKSLPRYLQ